MAKFVPSLDIYRPVINAIQDDIELLGRGVNGRVIESLGQAAARSIRFLASGDIRCTPVTGRELVGFHKEQELRFGRTEAAVLRAHLHEALAETIPLTTTTPSLPPTFYTVENRRGMSTFVSLGADDMQPIADRRAIQVATHELYELPADDETLAEAWEDNAHYGRLIIAIIRGENPDDIMDQFDAAALERPEIFAPELEIGALHIDRSGVKP